MVKCTVENGLPAGSEVKNLPPKKKKKRICPLTQETQVQSLGREDPREEGMATHSSVLAWRIPRTEETAGCSPWGCKESDVTEQPSTHASTLRWGKTAGVGALLLSHRGVRVGLFNRVKFEQRPEGSQAQPRGHLGEEGSREREQRQKSSEVRLSQSARGTAKWPVAETQ